MFLTSVIIIYVSLEILIVTNIALYIMKTLNRPDRQVLDIEVQDSGGLPVGLLVLSGVFGLALALHVLLLDDVRLVQGYSELPLGILDLLLLVGSIRLLRLRRVADIAVLVFDKHLRLAVDSRHLVYVILLVFLQGIR